MKLRNKKTGEIGTPRIDYQEIYIDTEDKMTYCYKLLQGVFEEWEYYEEPKDYWCIDIYSTGVEDFRNSRDDVDEFNKSIGNYFETKEEAELAVRKLKAWKRLKDKGFRFDKWFTRVEGGIQINMEYPKYDGIHAVDKVDLDLLFGGEE